MFITRGPILGVSYSSSETVLMFFLYSSYEPGTQETLTMGAHLTAHGDGAKDVAFSVEDLDAIIGMSNF